MGRLGTDRTFYVSDKADQVKIPSDFAGVTEALFQSRPDGNLQAAVATACERIVRQIRKLGIVANQRAFSRFAENIQIGFKIEDAIFQEEIRFRFDDWYSEVEEWAEGTVKVTENYNDLLLRVYERAKRSIFSTSVPSYRKVWRGEMGRRILQVQKNNTNAKSARVFIFDNHTDILEEDHRIFESHLEHGVEVFLFIDSTTEFFSFPSDLGNDWTIVDEGEMIGVNRNVGSIYEATWYFNDARRKEKFKRFEGSLKRFSSKYEPGSFQTNAKAVSG